LCENAGETTANSYLTKHPFIVIVSFLLKIIFKDIYGNYNVVDGNNGNANDNNSNDSTIHMILARKRTKRILAFGKREFVFVSVTGDKPLDDGTWVSGTVSVELNETKTENDNEGDDENENDTTTATSLPYRNKSYTRAFQDSIAFYKPIPPSAGTTSSSSSSSSSLSGGERTKLTIICRIDLNDSSSSTSDGDGGGGGGGCIPMWLYVKTIGITGARSVLNMRRALLEEEDED
jgi:hypothetical protein